VFNSTTIEDDGNKVSWTLGWVLVHDQYERMATPGYPPAAGDRATDETKALHRQCQATALTILSYGIGPIYPQFDGKYTIAKYDTMPTINGEPFLPATEYFKACEAKGQNSESIIEAQIAHLKDELNVVHNGPNRSFQR
jgi:hypothetical protein